MTLCTAPPLSCKLFCLHNYKAFAAVTWPIRVVRMYQPAITLSNQPFLDLCCRCFPGQHRIVTTNCIDSKHMTRKSSSRDYDNILMFPVLLFLTDSLACSSLLMPGSPSGTSSAAYIKIIKLTTMEPPPSAWFLPRPPFLCTLTNIHTSSYIGVPLSMVLSPQSHHLCSAISSQLACSSYYQRGMAKSPLLRSKLFVHAASMLDPSSHIYIIIPPLSCLSLLCITSAVLVFLRGFLLESASVMSNSFFIVSAVLFCGFWPAGDRKLGEGD